MPAEQVFGGTGVEAIGRLRLFTAQQGEVFLADDEVEKAGLGTD